jgi:ATP-dependent DNA ligase
MLSVELTGKSRAGVNQSGIFRSARREISQQAEAKTRKHQTIRKRTGLFPTLKRLKAAQCPFTNLPEKRASRWGESLTAEKMAQCRWVTPKLVCQVAFVDWTDAGHLRHCSFLALREDRKPAEVIRET